MATDTVRVKGPRASGGAGGVVRGECEGRLVPGGGRARRG
jgi:hypothetical protein